MRGDPENVVDTHLRGLAGELDDALLEAGHLYRGGGVSLEYHVCGYFDHRLGARLHGPSRFRPRHVGLRRRIRMHLQGPRVGK